MAYISKKQREVNSIPIWRKDGKVKSVACMYERGHNYWQIEMEKKTHWGTDLSYEFLIAIGCKDSDYIKTGIHNKLIKRKEKRNGN